MNVALFHPWLKSRGGAEKVVLEYAARSAHDVTVFTLFHDAENTFDAFSAVDVQVLGDNEPPKGLFDRAVRFGIGSLTADLPLEGFDALLVSEAGLGSLVTLRNHSLPVVCYCHTPLRAALPGFAETYREEHHLVKRPMLRALAFKYSLLEARAWTHFDRVICNSETTKERVIRKDLAPLEDLYVVHPGADVEAFAQGDFDHYFLYPSRFRRYKRQDLAIDAFKQADLPDDFELVLAGSKQEEDYVRELRMQAGGDDRITFRFDVDDATWRDLYANSYAVLFLAQEEDWGIIPIEAAAAGKPVIAADEGGALESVRHDETGLLVEPTVDAVAAAMEELAADETEAQRLGEEGVKHAQQYSWDAFAEKLDGEMEDVAEA